MYTRYEIGFGSRMTPGVKTLIIANAAVFFLQLFSGDYLILLFGLTPAKALFELHIWQFFTYMFLHSTRDLFHILMNMFILWMFGCEIERHWGTRDFYTYYFATGIGAGLFNVLVTPASTMPIIGASGAIFGILLAFGLLFPNREILFMFLIRMKAKHFVLIIGAIEFFSGFGLQRDGIAHFAHLGGMIVGYLMLRLDWRASGLSDKLGSIFSRRPRMKIHYGGKNRHTPDKNEDMRERIDRILDKINEVGYENLTDEERDILKKASSYFVNRYK